jgi:hypothetical protein
MQREEHPTKSQWGASCSSIVLSSIVIEILVQFELCRMVGRFFGVSVQGRAFGGTFGDGGQIFLTCKSRERERDTEICEDTIGKNQIQET